MSKGVRVESICRLYGKPGTWDSFLAFEAKMRVQRKKEAELINVKLLLQLNIYLDLIATLSVGGFVVLYLFTEILKEL